MTYREALHIGSKAEGIIKCTYATIYADEKTPLFSMQRVKAIKGIVFENGYSDEANLNDAQIVQLSPNLYWVDGGSRYGGADARVSVEFPMVQVTSVENSRLVHATLLPEAVAIIQDSLRNATSKAYKFTIWRVALQDMPGAKAGTRRKVREQWKQPTVLELQALRTEKWNVEVTSEYMLQPRYEKLLEILGTTREVLIKPAAFDYEPTDINNATVTEYDEDGNPISITLNDKLKEKTAALNKAKAILVAAGVTSLI